MEALFLSTGRGLAEIPAEVLSQSSNDNCLPRLRAHLADLGTGAVPLRDLKVIILGNGRIGKTQICRRLRGEPFEPEADSTHGISVTSVELAMPQGQDPATLNLWDFGGQDLYHGTHALFMRTRAVFLLVWTPGSECGEHEHGGQVFRNRPCPTGWNTSATWAARQARWCWSRTNATAAGASGRTSWWTRTCCNRSRRTVGSSPGSPTAPRTTPAGCA
ncbi:hypothetical protein [uncultured Thiodictyon sp.]|uniref:hypothetical protein n=1 Tax=uncultured Thiodictyon sp. TaxID=1846217 RepID=UPI0025CD081F|nr:hypothetical protein [uncultured Thiodictyon sp.]